MPGFDKTGPRGCGPMTGRGRGACGGFSRGFGGGRGSGAGRGFGRGARFGRQLAEDFPDLPPDEERRLLKAGRARLKAELARTEERLREIGRQDQADPEGDTIRDPE